MKTPENPLSSALLESSMMVCGGVSGIADNASAIFVFAMKLKLSSSMQSRQAGAANSILARG
jgi:hypothetical protein